MGNIASRQLAMGYQRAGQRPSCRNCSHGEVPPRQPSCLPFARDLLLCRKGGFTTTPYAVCAEHELAGARP